MRSTRSFTSRSGMLALLAIIPVAVAMPPVWADENPAADAWQKAMTPGEPHHELADQAGEWRYVVTIWEDPESEPMKLEGVSIKTMIMGGRYLQEELSGEFMDRPFTGFGITGYDNVTGEYVGIWLDNMSTGINFYTGSEDDSGAHNYSSTVHDPMTGRPIQTRSVGRIIDRDHHTFESYVKLPDGTEQLHMRVEYTRAVL